MSDIWLHLTLLHRSLSGCWLQAIAYIFDRIDAHKTTTALFTCAQVVHWRFGDDGERCVLDYRPFKVIVNLKSRDVIIERQK